MIPEMPLDIQWFLYALAGNEAVSVEEGNAIFASLPPGSDISAFAQEVVNRLAEDLSDDETDALLEQLQQLLDYAVEQASTGELPPFDYDAEGEVGDEGAEYGYDDEYSAAGGSGSISAAIPITD